ncbi:MAG: NRAMP family divalent metal transporter [Candidatus Marsarchaeota archaeon]
MGARKGARGSAGFWAVFGPAWITMMADMDAPSIVTALVSGEQFGYRLVSLMILLIIPLYLVQEMAGRLGSVTGKGLAFLVRERYGKRWSSITVGGVFLVDSLAYVGEFAGVVAGGELLGLPLAVSLSLAFAFHTAIVLTGSYKKVERILLLLSSFLLLFVVMALISKPNAGQLLAGMNPFQPYMDSSFAYMAVADIGAVVMPFMIFYQQSAVIDKRLSKRDLRWEKLETFLGSVATQFLMICVMVASAAVASRMGGKAEADDLSLVFSAIGGRLGVMVFAIGLIAAGFLAAITISLASAYGTGEYFGWTSTLNQRDFKSPFYILYFTEVIPAIVVIAWFQRLVPIIIDAMALNGLVLIFPLFFLIKLSGDEAVMGEYRNGKLRQAVSWLMALIITALSVFAFVTQFLRATRFYLRGTNTS